jgi:YggT family protein
LIGLTGAPPGDSCRVPDGAALILVSVLSCCPADCDFMYTIGYFVIALAKVFDLVLTLYLWIIIARAVLSWVNPDPYNPIVRFIHSVTEPILVRIRSRLPLYFGGFDFTPLLVLAVIYFLKAFLVESLYRFGGSLL